MSGKLSKKEGKGIVKHSETKVGHGLSQVKWMEGKKFKVCLNVQFSNSQKDRERIENSPLWEYNKTERSSFCLLM